MTERTVIAGRCSLLSTHRVLISVKPAFGVFGRRARLGRIGILLASHAVNECAQRGSLDQPSYSQGTTERFTSLGLVVARRVIVDPGTSSRHPSLRVWLQHRGVADLDRHHTEEVRPAIAAAAPHARAHGSCQDRTHRAVTSSVLMTTVATHTGRAEFWPQPTGWLHPSASLRSRHLHPKNRTPGVGRFDPPALERTVPAALERTVSAALSRTGPGPGVRRVGCQSANR